jgi:uncharacterized protein YbjT (DUF2867 family)
VEQVLSVVRHTTGAVSPKLTELAHENFYDWTGVEDQFNGYDACFFCLGVSAVGMKEADYRHITYDLTLSVAEVLVRHRVKTFIYVSGQSTNEHGRAMWARVKGATESALQQLPFPKVFCFRPGYIQPLNGVRSKVGWYNVIYAALGWAYPVLRRLAKPFVTSTQEVGLAMVSVAAQGYPKQVLETTDIAAAARRP